VSKSPYPQTEAELDKLSLAQIDQEIAHVQQRMGMAGMRYHVKAGFSRLLWLDRYRAQRFDLPMPERSQRARQR